MFDQNQLSQPNSQKLFQINSLDKSDKQESVNQNEKCNSKSSSIENKQETIQPPFCQKKQNAKKSSKRARKTTHKEMQCYIESKMCQYCRGQENQQHLLLCDRCDDSFHTYCLKPPLKALPETEWICDICIKQREQLQSKKKLQNMHQIIENNCFSCQKSLSKLPSIKGVDQSGNQIEIALKTLDNIKCLYCKHFFHNPCFSQRKNSLNCWNCERYIRKNGPKCHDEFMKWIQDCTKSVNSNQCKFTIIHNIQEDNKQLQTHRYYRLKVPSYMTTWQSIAENQASIYYSFKTKGLTFVDEQLYQKQHFQFMMKMNRPQKDINGPILRLHINDQLTYEKFKQNSRLGYVGPFEVKQDRIKGFYLIASEFIQPNTIVSEYVGEVKTARIALNFQQNDSIFLLVRSPRSAESLDIVPQLYGNISRFFLGINNQYKRIHGSSNLQNIKSLRFSYKGRVRLLLYTSKPIQSGETLYFNYNGSAFHQYPTDHFIT